MTRVARWWWRRARTIWPTRDGWWCLFAAVGLGVAAVNTGNNLAYLLCSMLLALILVSGVLSDQSMRGLHLGAALPEEVYAGRPALFGVILGNRKHRLPSYSIAVEVGGVMGHPAGVGGGKRVFYVPRLEAREERLCSWEATLPTRGRQRLPGLRVTTRFPFGLFVKMDPVALEPEVLVYPAVGPLSPDRLRQIGAAGRAATRRRGRGHDLYNLRPYRPGDEPRLIHWRSSAKAGVLTVRELEEATALDTRLVLEGTGRRDPQRLERGLSEAASLAVHLLRAGTGVEVVGAGVSVPLGRSRAHERRILTALALYDPEADGSGGSGGSRAPVQAPATAIRELRVPLD